MKYHFNQIFSNVYCKVHCVRLLDIASSRTLSIAGNELIN